MKKVTQPICLLLSLLVSVTACKKNQDIYIPVSPIHNMTKMEKDGAIMQAVYNNDGSIQKINLTQSNGTHLTNYAFVYADGKLQEIDFGGKWKYYYTGNKVSSVETINTAGLVRYRTELAYTDNRISEKTEFLVNAATGSNAYAKTKYYYTTEGNILKKELFDFINGAWKKAEDILIPLYDHNPNTNQHFENYPYLPISSFSVNNPLQENYTNDQGELIGTVMHTYTYDTKGRPLTRKTRYTYPGFPDTFSDAKFYY